VADVTVRLEGGREERREGGKEGEEEEETGLRAWLLAHVLLLASLPPSLPPFLPSSFLPSLPSPGGSSLLLLVTKDCMGPSRIRQELALDLKA